MYPVICTRDSGLQRGLGIGVHFGPVGELIVSHRELLKCGVELHGAGKGPCSLAADTIALQVQLSEPSVRLEPVCECADANWTDAVVVQVQSLQATARVAQ